MKSVCLASLLLLSIPYANSQNCGGIGVSFVNQASLDNFLTDNPDCEGFEDYLNISGTVSDLSGLSQFTSIGGYLTIANTVGLTSLSGLEGLTSIGGNVSIDDNADLTSIIALSGLTSVSGQLTIDSNPLLSNLSGLENMSSVGERLNMAQNGFTNIDALSNLVTVGGELTISNNPSLQNLNGLAQLSSIGERLSITQNPSLVSLMPEGCPLSQIGGAVNIVQNPLLADISGLGSLVSVGDQFRLEDATTLPSLHGLESLTTIGGNLSLENLDALEDLSELSNFSTMVGRLSVTYNDNLYSLNGLDNIDPSGIDELIIRDNPSLSECSVATVCVILDADAIDISVEANFAGCDNPGQILAFCALGSGDVNSNTGVQAYPNPVSHLLQFSGVRLPAEVSIFDNTGRCILWEQITHSQLDVSDLPAGVYSLRVGSGQEFETMRVVRE